MSSTIDTAGQPANDTFTKTFETIVGKTIQSVEHLQAKPRKGVHRTEILIIGFTDETKLTVDTGTNVHNVSGEHGDFEESEVDVYLRCFPD